MSTKYLIVVNVTIQMAFEDLVTTLQSAYATGAAGYFRVFTGQHDLIANNFYTIVFERDISEDHEYVAKKMLKHGVLAPMAAMWQLADELIEESDGQACFKAIDNALRIGGPNVGCYDLNGALESMDSSKSSDQAHKACKPDMLVNGGALQLALNTLRRGSPIQNEIAEELAKTATPAPLTQTVEEHAPKHSTTAAEAKTTIVLADMMGPSDEARKLQLDQYHARLNKAASTNPLERAINGEKYANCTVELMTLLGPDAHCAQVDCLLWDEYSDYIKSATGMRPRAHITRANVISELKKPQVA